MFSKNDLYLFYKTVHLKIKVYLKIKTQLNRMLFKFFEISIVYPYILAEKN